MAFLIGTDEAGYGPNLGPLVISATVWEVPDGVDGRGLYERLGTSVSSRPARRTPAAAPLVAMADSKRLYQSGQGLDGLERGLWAAWQAEGERGCTPCSIGEVWQRLGGPSPIERTAALSGGCDAEPAPLDADPEEVRRLGPAFAQTLSTAGVRLISLVSRAIFPQEFNAAVARYGSKGEALSRWTLTLLGGVLAPLGDGPIAVLCDKHGGRSHYLPLLAEFFPDCFIEVRGEGRQQSVYRFGPPHRRVEICFQAKGESHLPTALASMASKYLRELAMRALNAFCCARLPGLRPTAGYPQDARRFRTEIAGMLQELGIADTMLWRCQ